MLLNRCKKKLLKEVAYSILERENFAYKEGREQWYLYVSDIIDTLLWKEIAPLEKKTHGKNPCIIHFINKGLNRLGLSKIFRLPDVVASLPPELQGDNEVPFPTYKLAAPIRNKILNYKEAINSVHIDIDEDVSIVHNLPSCECSSSPFCDPHHKHIVTGDLRIIENQKLRKLFSKGPNYREAKPFNLKKCKDAIISSLDETILKLAERYKLNVVVFMNWKNTILSKINSRIASLHHIKPQSTKPVLKDPEAKAYLDNLHSKFVVVPIDKASNNVAIVCKRFYITSILDELGIPGNSSSTYELIDKPALSIIEDNHHLVQYILGSKLDEKSLSLPQIYWMPKMHYSPCRKRFIIASAHCSTKPLSKIISKIFRHIFNQIHNYHEKCTFYKNYNKFWVIQNSSPLLKNLDEINLKKNAREISTFDFSTLYTKLPHDDLIRVLLEMVDFAFNGGKFKNSGSRKFLTVFNDYSYWTRKSRGSNSFSKNKIKSLTTHLIKECHFQFANLTLRQCIGIPMGIDPAPFWANLYLYYYEEKHVSTLMKSNRSLARRYKYAARFIDDQCNLNDCSQFKNTCHTIYPPELQVKCEHEGQHATFLELDITVNNDIFVYKLFDKRDDFPFFIIRMPDLSGNIPDHVFYGSVMSEFLRIARATLLYPDFISKATDLYRRMLNQNGDKKMLLSQLQKAITKHSNAFNKYQKSSRDILNDLEHTS